MRVKRIYATNIRSGMRKMKQELGEEAVILANRKHATGIELIVGVDYNQDAVRSLASGGDSTFSVDSGGKSPAFRSTLEPLKTSKSSALSQHSYKSTAGAVNKNKELQAAIDYKVKQLAKLTNKEKEALVSNADIKKLQQPLIEGLRKEFDSLSAQMRDQMNYLGWSKWAAELPQQADLLRKLTAIGLGSRFCKEIMRRVGKEDSADKAWRQALGVWAHHLTVSDNSILDTGGIIALIGPTGVGKTTTAAKLAAKFAERHGKHSVMLIANDNQRLGAHEQLLSLGRALGISVVSAADNFELRATLQNIGNKRLVLIDSGGVRPNDPHAASQNRIFSDRKLKIQQHVVLSCNVQISALDNFARYYKARNIRSCILTKLDEAVSLGGVLTVVASHHLPLSYVTHGPEVPDDIQPAKVSLLLSKAVALSKDQQCEPDEDIMATRFGNSAARTAVLQ